MEFFWNHRTFSSEITEHSLLKSPNIPVRLIHPRLKYRGIEFFWMSKYFFGVTEDTDTERVCIRHHVLRLRFYPPELIEWSPVHVSHASEIHCRSRTSVEDVRILGKLTVIRYFHNNPVFLPVFDVILPRRTHPIAQRFPAELRYGAGDMLPIESVEDYLIAVPCEREREDFIEIGTKHIIIVHLFLPEHSASPWTESK